MPEFGVLGPVLATAAGEGRALPGKERVILAALLLRTGRVVAVDDLVEALWDAEPPRSARNTVQWHVKQLRQLLGPGLGERIVTRAPGYQIEVLPGELDLDRFTGLSDRGKAALEAGNWAQASALLADALALWRGEPLSDVPSAALRRGEVPRLAELRARALEARIEADLRSGRHEEIIPELRRLAAAYPYRERAWAQLMLALYRSGRQVEALDAYQQARSALRDGLGIEPGTDLRRLHQQVLTADPALTEGIPGISRTKAPPGDPPLTAVPPPRQLPADVPDFTGRGPEIEALTGLLSIRDPARPGAVTVAVLAGPGGIGKTALAVHVAHRIAEQYAGGQLFVGLGGATSALSSSEVLARFLRDLGVPDSAIPAAEVERAARYRTLLADQEMLVVLDDAKDATQVRPLLPGTASCAVIITSRGTLAGLPGAALAGLPPLDQDASRALLTAIVGRPRAVADPEGTDEVLRWCGGLPLALRIAGSRLAARPEWSIAWLGALLASEQRRLAELATGDLAVRACFETSYRALPGDSARLFRLFGLTQLKGVSLGALAAVAGLADADADAAAETLLEVHLLEPVADDRLSTHDLLRRYAAERAAAEESEESRREALRRILTWYLHAVRSAVATLGAQRQPFELATLPPEIRAPVFRDRAEALAWLGAERANLVTAVGHAADAGRDDICHQLARLLRRFHEWSGYWNDLVAVSETGLGAAEAAGDEAAIAMLLTGLGSARWKLGDVPTATGLYTRSLGISQRRGDKLGQAIALAQLGLMASTSGEHDLAISRFTDALDLNRAIGNPAFEAYMLHNIGHVYQVTGRLTEALDHHQRALAIHAEMRTLHDHAASLHSIGETLLLLGRTEEAMDQLAAALVICADNSMRYAEGMTLASLGDGYQALGKTREAREHWQRAYDMLADLGAAEAEAARDRLGGPSGAPGASSPSGASGPFPKIV